MGFCIGSYSHQAHRIQYFRLTVPQELGRARGKTTCTSECGEAGEQEYCQPGSPSEVDGFGVLESQGAHDHGMLGNQQVAGEQLHVRVRRGHDGEAPKHEAGRRDAFCNQCRVCE